MTIDTIEAILEREFNEVSLRSRLEAVVKGNDKVPEKYLEILEEVEFFIEDIGDNDTLPTKESVLEKIREYEAKRPILGNYPIYKRYEKEIRELKDLAGKKPTEKALKYQKFLKEAPTCPKCSSVCIPRLGKDTDCWQCEAGHWRKRMTPEQREKLAQLG